jgi:TonB-dependent siderophore receptor
MRTRLAALVALGGWPLLAGAQDQDPKPDDAAARFVDTVNVESELPALPPASTSATRLPVPVKDLPLSLSVVPGRLLREQDAFVLNDALKNASGVNVGSGFGVFDFFVVRGFDSLSSGLVLTDGAPEPESVFYPMYNVRQVEVLKGPAAFLYGANPLAGAIQLVRKQPSARRFADVSLTYGRFGTFQAAVDGNTATTDGKLQARLNGTWQGTDSHRDLESGSIQAINPAALWQPDDRTKVGLNLEYLNSAWPPDTGLPFVGAEGSTLAPVPRETSYQSPYDDSDQEVLRVRVDAERRLGSAATLRNRFYVTRLDWDSVGTLVSGVFPGADGRTQVARTATALHDRQVLVGNQLEAAATFQTGRVRHELLGGLELLKYTDEFTQDVAFLAPLDLLEPVEPDLGPPVPVPAFARRGDATSTAIAPYLVDRIAVSSKVQAFVGARFDVLDYEDEPSATDRSDQELSPLLGLVVSPTSTVALHASFGTSFAPPSTQVVGPREPEKGRQLELGAKLQLMNGKGFLGASLYDLRREDIAIPDATGVLKQVGDQRSRGFELDFTAEPAEGLVTYATYAFTDAELTSFSEIVPLPTGPVLADHSGNTPAFAPRHLASLWVSKQWKGGLGLAGGLRVVSDQFVGENNAYSIDGYATVDAQASYRVGRARFTVNLKNLTGAEYASRGFGGVSAIPARPFEVLGRVELGFGSR